MLSVRPPKAEAEPTHSAAHSDQLASPKPSATVTFLHEWKLHHLPPDTKLLPSVTPL
ncbi:hypothetical protein [Streptomyces sp. NPDC058256]|uniref:hypothetical protein n=1 Tax=Streptomyces sp. NPDC058256 TaxID=3346408 RepID=UPI0036EF8868